MEKIITKLVEKWWWVMVVLLLGGIYLYGLKNMYFHQDDLDWFILANHPFWQVMAAPLGDHVDYLFRVLLKLEWDGFGLFFPGYFTVSIIMHGMVIWILYVLTKITTQRRDLAAVSAAIFSVNMNWSETVLWISGQTISITALFVLLAMLAIWKKKGEVMTLFLASWTSALALGLPGAALLVYGFKWPKVKLTQVGQGVLYSLVVVAIMYYWKGTDGTSIETSWEWVVHVGMVWGLMMVNSVVGRLLIPFDRFETLRIGITSALLANGLWRWRVKLPGIWSDLWSRFLLIQMGIYYLVVAVGRAQYGVGIMRADRYAYLGLALLLLLVARVLRHAKPGKWIWMAPILITMQCLGFYVKARAYVVRPQQLRALVAEIRVMDREQIDPEAFLPHFVFNDERLRYKDLLNLMKD